MWPAAQQIAADWITPIMFTAMNRNVRSSGSSNPTQHSASIKADLDLTNAQLRVPGSVDKGSGEPHKTKVATVTRDQVREIAQTKMADLNANDLDQAEKIIAGTARSMGITVTG